MKSEHFLITGGAGFIGSNLAAELLTQQKRVTVLDDLSTGFIENIEFLQGLAAQKKSGFRFIKGDIRDPETCTEACRDIDYVLHHAALGSVPRSIKDPLLTHQVNVDGFLNILLAAREAKVKRVVYASSSSVYGNADQIPNQEGKESACLSPYAVSKKINELYAANFSQVYGMSVIGLRYFNVFGPRQNPHSQYAAVIPIFISTLLEGKTPVIYGDGKTSRDFTFIQNVVAGNLKACHTTAPVDGEVFNIACGGNCSLNQLYGLIAGYLGSTIPPEHEPPRKGDIQFSQASIEKASRMMGYRPLVSLEDGLRMTVDWFTGTQGRAKTTVELNSKK